MTLSDIPYIRWAKEQGPFGELSLTMSAVPPVDWSDLDFDPRDLALFEFSAYGDEELRDGIAAQWGWGRERVFLGSSATHAHFCFAASALEPGDRVLYECPGYLPLLDALSLLQVEAVPFERRFEDRFRLPTDRLLEAARDPRAKLVLITDLHNPSGVSLQRSEAEFIAQLCEETEVEVIVDEMYRPFLDPDPEPHCALHEGIVSIRGFNKVHGLSQIRIGWGIASRERVARAQRILDATTIHNSCLTDQVGRAAWLVRERLVERGRKIARDGWKILGEWLDRSPLEFVPPAAGLVSFPRIPERLFASGDAFREAALAAGVNVTPGRFFGAPHHIRFGCGLPAERLGEALRRLDGVLSDAARDAKADLGNDFRQA